MRLGRPRLLTLVQVHAHAADLLRQAFMGRDQDFGGYWEIFTQGTPGQVQNLCIHLQNKGYSDFLGRCDHSDPHSYVSRIVEGRSHPKFPKARQDAQMQFLARFAAVGKYVSAKTWKRSIARQDVITVSSPENDIFPEIDWTEKDS